jgi:hypothetical protein
MNNTIILYSYKAAKSLTNVVSPQPSNTPTQAPYSLSQRNQVKSSRSSVSYKYSHLSAIARPPPKTSSIRPSSVPLSPLFSLYTSSLSLPAASNLPFPSTRVRGVLFGVRRQGGGGSSGLRVRIGRFLPGRGFFLIGSRVHAETAISISMRIQDKGHEKRE